VNIRWATTTGLSGRFPKVMPAIDASPMLTATGMFRNIRMTRVVNMIVAMLHHLRISR